MKLLALLAATATVGLGQYATFAEAERKLADLARLNPAVMTLETIGNSAGGRRIYAVRLAAPGTVSPELRPAVFVGANLVGYHNAGTQAALGLVESLLAKIGLFSSQAAEALTTMTAGKTWRDVTGLRRTRRPHG